MYAWRLASYFPSMPVMPNMELVAAAFTPSSVHREPMKKSFPVVSDHFKMHHLWSLQSAPPFKGVGH